VYVGMSSFLVRGQALSLKYFNRGGVIMQDTELVVTATLCFASGDFHISTDNSYPASAGTRVLVCGQNII
jgi:hypothetical protein